MQELRRLLSHLRPYSLQFSVSVLLMAAVGALGAFPVLLLGPIVDKVLNPSSPGQALRLFQLPGSHRWIYLQQFIPRYWHNPLSVVAAALIGGRTAPRWPPAGFALPSISSGKGAR